MINLTRLFEDFFDADDLSATEKVTTAAEWVGRMTLNNTGAVFSSRITALQGAVNSVEASSSDQGMKMALQKTATKNKRNFRIALVGKMSKVHAKVVAQFGKDSAQLVGVFPKGLSPFSENSKDEPVENELQVVIAGLMTYQAELTTAPATEVGGYLSDWIVVYNAAKSSKTAKVTSGASGTNLMKALQIEMTKTALFVAFTFAGDTTKSNLYLPTTELFNDEAHPPGPCSIVDLLGGEGSISLKANAAGATLVRVFQRLVGATVWVEMGTCEPGQEVSFDMLPPGNYEVKAHGENEQGSGTESAVGTVAVA